MAWNNGLTKQAKTFVLFFRPLFEDIFQDILPGHSFRTFFQGIISGHFLRHISGHFLRRISGHSSGHDFGQKFQAILENASGLLVKDSCDCFVSVSHDGISERQLIYCARV